MSEKEKVLQLAREKYKTETVSKYDINVAGTCLIDAFIKIRGYATWGNLMDFLMNNFGMKRFGNYDSEYNCKMFLKDFKFEQKQKTMKNE